MCVLALLGQDNGHNVTRVSGSRRPSRSVQVSLVLGGLIDVHHQFDARDMHAARGDVGATSTRASPVVKAARFQSHAS